MVITNFRFKTLGLLMAITTFIELIAGVRVPMQISKDVAKHICQHRTSFAERGVLEEATRSRYRPISPLRCGWYSFGNCDKSGRCSYQSYEDCEDKIKGPKMFHSRIHGGQESVAHSHPSMVLVYGKKGGCGGVIIDEEWVLTAAHCTIDSNEQDITVIAGRHNLDDVLTEQSMQQRIAGVKKIYEHPKYKPNVYEVTPNDICLLELYEYKKFKFTKYVGFADIGTYRATGKATLVGWGKRNDDSFYGPLHEVEMTIISDPSCRKFFGDQLKNQNICTYDKGKSACFGDSGGPLYQFLDGETFVIAIANGAAENCSLTDIPTVYSELFYYQGWISAFIPQKKKQDFGKQRPLRRSHTVFSQDFANVR